GSPRIQLPPDMHDWVDATSDGWIAELAGAGYDVVGDLDELRPQSGEERWYDPDEPNPGDQLRAAYAAIETLLLEIARLEADRPEPIGPPPRRERAKRRLVGAAGRWRVLGWMLRGYRKLRRR